MIYFKAKLLNVWGIHHCVFIEYHPFCQYKYPFCHLYVWMFSILNSILILMHMLPSCGHMGYLFQPFIFYLCVSFVLGAFRRNSMWLAILYPIWAFLSLTKGFICNYFVYWSMPLNLFYVHTRISYCSYFSLQPFVASHVFLILFLFLL